MKSPLIFKVSILALCEQALAETPELASNVEKTTSAVPESSFAILLGGILWFLLLRKRA